MKNKEKPPTTLSKIDIKPSPTMKKKPKFDSYNLLVYVLNSTPHIKKFDTMDKMRKFVDNFHRKYPDHMSIDSGNWIDYVVTDVRGEIFFFTDGVKLK